MSNTSQNQSSFSSITPIKTKVQIVLELVRANKITDEEAHILLMPERVYFPNPLPA